ncbi:GNAT family N-acetyltransferase [Roseobacteraceae bacterium S113]
MYSFDPVTSADLALIASWRAAPHVRAWWGDGEPLDTDALADARVARWLVRYHGQPFAYIQDYDVHGWPEHHFGHLPPGARGIDQYIGLAEMVGRGHGTGFIKAHVAALFATGAPAVGTDPDPDNAAAIAAYRKVGFAPAGPAQDTQWGRILPMVIHP